MPRADGPQRPTKAEIAAAEGARVPDVIGPGLLVLFCGINPGLYSGATGHHFARPGNRFWKALHAAGFTDRALSPFEDRDLLDHGLGVTNLVSRSTASADLLSSEELRSGASDLSRKVARVRPRSVAVLGIGAYRRAFSFPRAVPGEQPDPISGSRAWVLPNPSGLNAQYQISALARAFAELHRTVTSS
jgi:TDG/mug DNA glycosylase family protein